VDPEAPGAEPPEGLVELEPGFVPPDPEEAPPVDLWSAVGDVPPWGTALLVLSWAVVFALFALRGQMSDDAAFLAHGASATGLPPLAAAWRLLGSTFLHAGVLHLVMNTATMLVFGPAVERIYTRGGLLLIYAGGGAAASLASLVWRTWRQGPIGSISVGASGAIFALGGALLIGAFRLRHRLARGRARALGAALLFLVGTSLANGATSVGTDSVAHAAGIVGGLSLGAIVPLDVRLGGTPRRAWIRGCEILAGASLAVAFGLVLRGA
jgi:membrane associated rhomboid family serine protease